MKTPGACNRCGELTAFRTCVHCRMVRAGVIPDLPVRHVRRWVSVRAANIHISERLYLQAKRIVMGPYWGQSPRLGQARRISVEYGRLMGENGMPVYDGPTPGWSVADDIREEMIALGEVTALRKVG